MILTLKSRLCFDNIMWFLQLYDLNVQVAVCIWTSWTLSPIMVVWNGAGIENKEELCVFVPWHKVPLCELSILPVPRFNVTDPIIKLILFFGGLASGFFCPSCVCSSVQSFSVLLLLKASTALKSLQPHRFEEQRRITWAWYEI